MDSVGMLTRFFTTEWFNMFLFGESSFRVTHVLFFYVSIYVTEGHKAQRSWIFHFDIFYIILITLL
jgi:hypothetical protein